MKYRVTLKSGEVYLFESPFTKDALRKAMNLPDTALIEELSAGGADDSGSSNNQVVG